MIIRILQSQRGFSFFAMMVLVIFMAVAASIVAVSVDTNVSNQSMDETIKKMDRIEAAVIKFNFNFLEQAVAANRYPLTLDRLYTIGTLTACSSSTTLSKMQNWCGPYLSATVTNDSTDFLVDGWGTSFEWDQTTHTVYSWGPNKIDNNGASDDITRVVP